MKLFLASEKFYDIPDSLEATVLLIAAEDKEAAFRNATFSVCPDESRSFLTPMFDIWELGDFIPLPAIWDGLKKHPENITGGVTILSGYEPVEYSEIEARYRNHLHLRCNQFAPDNYYAYYDELKKSRDNFFSFTEKKGWLYREEEHLGFKVPVWVDPIWDQLIEVYGAGHTLQG